MLEGDLAAERDEAQSVLAAWGISARDVVFVGAVPGMAGTTARPVVAIRGERYLLRRQSPDLTEDDLRFRHAFMRHLHDAGLPVPALLPRPDGSTVAVTDDGGIYEVQGWLDGREYQTNDAVDSAELEAAASMLGRLHQASASFAGTPHRWPPERSADGLALAYIALIEQAAGDAGMSAAITTSLGRIAEACDARRAAVAVALAAEPAPPQLHIHGDYQAHNLRFAAGNISAIYDFDATRWESRVLELAYALLYFTGVRWDDATSPTPPLVDDGLDILRVHRFLVAYGREAPPAEGEAQLLADALALAFPIIFVNGVVEDLVFPDDFDEVAGDEDALARLHWAETFWPWLDRYRETLAQAWESAS
jgi:Ser/Thr protein kinase RdoA (MazF antagonist)